MAEKTTKQSYWPELDGLRAVAILLVFLHHCPPFRPEGRATIQWAIYQLSHWGWMGVDLFFVLSGFLITYLLLKERSQFKSISLPLFYARRALRIWPLYFLALAGAALYPLVFHGWDFGYAHFLQAIILPMLFFVGNYAIMLGGADITSFANSAHLHRQILTSLITPFWSISVEEQFYLLCAHHLDLHPIGAEFLDNNVVAIWCCFNISSSIVSVRTGHGSGACGLLHEYSHTSGRFDGWSSFGNGRIQSSWLVCSLHPRRVSMAAFGSAPGCDRRHHFFSTAYNGKAHFHSADYDGITPGVWHDPVVGDELGTVATFDRQSSLGLDWSDLLLDVHLPHAVYLLGAVVQSNHVAQHVHKLDVYILVLPSCDHCGFSIIMVAD